MNKKTHLTLTVLTALTAISSLLISPQAHAVERSQRKLLVIANMVDNGDPKFTWLYQFLQASAVSLAQLTLSPVYSQVVAQTGSAVTRNAFSAAIGNVARTTNELDVIVALHGSPGTLHFADGPRASATLGSQVHALGLGGRLRALYSTACFGASHAQDFINAGFNVASGAVGVNANASYEYPAFIAKWALNNTYAVSLADNALLRMGSDAAARAAGFTGVDSTKVIKGNGAFRIQTDGN